MKIVMRNPKDLIPAEYNPRKLSSKQRDDITASLKRFDFVDPVLVNTHEDRKDIIVGGHQRTSVAIDLDYKKIPTVEVNLNLEQEKELNIRLNKNSGEFDFEKLEEFFEADTLVDWGFEEWEVEPVDELDYSLLEEDEDLDDKLEDMEAEVKRAIQIEFEGDDYEVAQDLIKSCRDNDIYIGGLIIEKLKSVEL